MMEIKKYEKEVNVEEIRQKLSKVGNQDFYVVKNNKGQISYEPSAKALQVWANEAGISTEILEYEIEDTYCFVRMSAWIGEKSNPKIYKEAMVKIDFKLKGYQWLFLQADQGNAKIKIENGKPVPADPVTEMKFLRYYFNLVDFAPRVAVTKCEAILFKKLLSLEFREQEEIEFEEQEIKQVEKQVESEKKAINTGITEKQIELLRKIENKYKDIIEELKQKYNVDKIENFTREMVSEAISKLNSAKPKEELI